MVYPLWKRLWQFLLKLSMCFPYNLAIALLGIYPMEKDNLCQHKNLYVNVHSTFIHNSKKTGNNPNVLQTVN